MERGGGEGESEKERMNVFAYKRAIMRVYITGQMVSIESNAILISCGEICAWMSKSSDSFVPGEKSLDTQDKC